MINVHSKHSYPDNWNFHKLSTHEGVRYYCDQCNYKTVLESRLRAHKKSRHEGIAEILAKVPVICDECGLKQSDVGNLRIHMKQMHEGKPESHINVTFVSSEPGIKST